MKAAIEKALSALSSYGRAQRVEGSEECPVGGQELHRVDNQSVRITRDTGDTSLSPEELYSEIAKNTIEGDDVLFSKNNIFLKQPLSTLDFLCNIGEGASNAEDNGSDKSESKSLDNHKLIPGFLFVTTRGSNFGTTLILNWAPNSSMKVPKMEDSGNHKLTATEVPGNISQCSSISIDLCSMEIIRIFYHMDEKGFIISGELVVKSKAEEFKVNKRSVIPVDTLMPSQHFNMLQG